MDLSTIFNSVGGGAQKVGQSLSGLFSNTPLHYVNPTNQPLDRNKFLSSLAINETGGVKGDPYKFSQPSGIVKYGKALGKYQITEANLKHDAPLYLGKSMTPAQFLASPEAQDNLVYNKSNMMHMRGYTPEQIVDIHNKGMTNSSAPGSTQYQNPDYVKKFSMNYNK